MQWSIPLPIIIVLFTALSASVAVASPDVLTVESAVSEGGQRSPEVQRAQAAAEEAGWRKTETLSGFLPSMNVSAERFLLHKYELLNVSLGGGAPIEFPTIYPITTAALNATLPIFDGLQNVYTYSAASHRQSAAEQTLEWTSFRTSQKIRLDFLKAIAAQDLQSVSEENLKTITDHLNQTQSLRKGGLATNYDVLRVEVQLNEAKSGVLSAQDNVILARRQLAISMGANEDLRTLEGELPVPDTRAIEKLQRPEDSSGRADLASLTNQAEASGKSASAAATYLIPRISLTGNFTEYNDLGTSWVNQREFRSAYNVGLVLSWNFFDGLASISRSKEAYYQQVQAEKSLEQARLQVPYDFDFWKRRYLYSATLYQSRKSDVDRSAESVRLAREGFRAGTGTSTEVLDAELDLFRARAGVVNAQIDCAEARINLELALGRRI